jgi:HEAT repeat protein
MSNHGLARRRSAACSAIVRNVFGAAVIVCALLTAQAASGQDLTKLNRFLQASDSSDPGIQLFNKGRDYIQEEKWADAMAQFNQFVKEYSSSPKTDAALYWLAYSLKKQDEFQKAGDALRELFKNYPKSTWIADAKAMAAEIDSERGNHTVVVVGPRPDQQIVTTTTGDAGAPGGQPHIDAIGSRDRGRPSEEDELKVVALRSLFNSNPERATALATEILKPGSKAHPNLRRAALSLVAQNGGKQGLAILESIARSEDEQELRKEAIFWLGRSGDEHALDLLKEMATSTTNAEVAKNAVFAISQSGSPRAAQMLGELAHSTKSMEVKKAAIRGLAQSQGEKALDQLIEIYNSDHDEAIGKEISFALSQIGGARAKAELLKIAKTADKPDVRRQAIFWLGNTFHAVDDLMAIYDSESAIDIKKQILFALGQSNQKKAVGKLIDIARSDKSPELRREAVICLGRSNDPDAEKFLEELLK